jgi:alpha-L-rhamnosidase
VRIEPHLGHLQQASTRMPHLRGEITVALRREGAGVVAEVSLPKDVSGTFVWSGRSVDLHGGAQKVRLP